MGGLEDLYSQMQGMSGVQEFMVGGYGQNWRYYAIPENTVAHDAHVKSFYGHLEERRIHYRHRKEARMKAAKRRALNSVRWKWRGAFGLSLNIVGLVIVYATGVTAGFLISPVVLLLAGDLAAAAAFFRSDTLERLRES